MYRRIEETIKSGAILTIPAPVERYFALIKGSSVDISLGLDGDSFDKIKEGNQIGSPDPFLQVRIRNPHTTDIEIDATIGVEPLRQVVLSIAGGSVELSSAVEVSNLPKRGDGSLNTGATDTEGARMVNAGLSFEGDKLLVDAGVPVENDQVMVDPDLKNAAGNVPVAIAGVSPTSTGKLPVDIGATVTLAADTELQIADGTSVEVSNRVKTANALVLGIPKSTTGNPAITETDFVTMGSGQILTGTASSYFTAPRRTGTGAPTLTQAVVLHTCVAHSQIFDTFITELVRIFVLPDDTDMAALFGTGCRNTLTTKPTATSIKIFDWVVGQSNETGGRLEEKRTFLPPIMIPTANFFIEVYAIAGGTVTNSYSYLFNWQIEYEE